MNSEQAHIEQLIKEKLENYQAVPPAHAWKGIEKGLAGQGKPALPFPYVKQLAVVALLILLALLLWLVLPGKQTSQQATKDLIEDFDQPQPENVTGQNDNRDQQIYTAEPETATEPVTEEASTQKTQPNPTQTAKVNTQPAPLTVTAKLPPEKQSHTANSVKSSNWITQLSSIDFALAMVNAQQRRLEAADRSKPPALYPKSNPLLTGDLPQGPEETTGFKKYWNIGLYFTPEWMLNNFDSVSLPGTYSLNIEPSWYFNKHWFIRFGAGAAYVRDNGFANVDYLTHDYIGSYDSVLNITFDTIDGELFPVYHTQEVEVWDSVQHLAIAEVSNKYYYFQVPLLFGYHNSTSRFKWYFYGGPAVNIKVTERIGKPETNFEYIEIVNLENNLPVRTTYSLQFWVGAGIDVRVGKRMSLAFEPNYRYYFKPVYNESKYKTALSGLSLRFGLVYKLTP